MIDLSTYFDLAYNILKLCIAVVICIALIRILTTVRFGKMLSDIHSGTETSMSWMRVMCTFVIFASFGLAAYQLIKFETVQETMIVGLVTAALLGKAGQKYAEKPSNKDIDKL